MKPNGMFKREQLYAPNGVKKSTGLFVETCKPEDTPLFSLIQEREGLIWLKSLFIPMVTTDPSEGLFAETVFGDVGFWLNVSKATRLKPFFDDWRKEADVRRKMEAFKVLNEEVQTRGKFAYSAAKYLIEEPWKEQSVKGKKASSSKDTTEDAFSSVFSKQDTKNLKTLLN